MLYYGQLVFFNFLEFLFIIIVLLSMFIIFYLRIHFPFIKKITKFEYLYVDFFDDEPLCLVNKYIIHMIFIFRLFLFQFFSIFILMILFSLIKVFILKDFS